MNMNVQHTERNELKLLKYWKTEGGKRVRDLLGDNAISNKFVKEKFIRQLQILLYTLLETELDFCHVISTWRKLTDMV